ncbi:hypothetical protein AAFF_G00153370 [Aldrovandia affinis]|uniref:Uncharacterized protein n=1 Tax=Aldrovandia affinis TaxID=143900 RepID=A0AAD7SZL2_9TELE|nr:hypothetical protein AAFF_G00153370 [Aldrovandia affinis]
MFHGSRACERTGRRGGSREAQVGGSCCPWGCVGGVECGTRGRSVSVGLSTQHFECVHRGMQRVSWGTCQGNPSRITPRHVTGVTFLLPINKHGHNVRAELPATITI